MRLTFRGGVHPPEHKEISRDKSLVAFDPKGEMVFPLSMHIGKPAKPIVQKGEAVKVGQLIAEADGFISARVFSSCSGTVKAIEERRVLTGQDALCIVIANDGAFTEAEGVGIERDADSMTGEEIVACVKEAGIVGLGGAGFPTHVKLAPKEPDKIRWIIANGAECEPYLSCNDRLMRESAGQIINGLTVMLKLFPNATAVIAIEDNKPEAVEAMRAACQGRERMEVRAMQTKYPQGGERSLIQAIAGVDFPTSKLPADYGCLVENVGTIYAIWRALRYSEPLFSHVLTLTGDAVKNPGNYIVRDGTLFSELLEHAGGLKEGVTVKKAMCGGPMMGIALSSLDVPIQKQNNGLVLLSNDESEKAEQQMTPCLRCGRCTTVCPQGLMPEMMAEAAENRDFKRYEKKLYGLECIQCGSCSYICPAKRPLTQLFKHTKAEILAQKRAEAGGKK